MKYYYTYVLRSRVDNKLYIGWTDNIKIRVAKHNKEKVQSTKDRVPMDLIYFEACRDKNKAVLREKQLKTGYGRAYLKRRLNF